MRKGCRQERKKENEREGSRCSVSKSRRGRNGASCERERKRREIKGVRGEERKERRRGRGDGRRRGGGRMTDGEKKRLLARGEKQGTCENVVNYKLPSNMCTKMSSFAHQPFFAEAHV